MRAIENGRTMIIYRAATSSHVGSSVHADVIKAWERAPRLPGISLVAADRFPQCPSNCSAT